MNSALNSKTAFHTLAPDANQQ